ncbi:MAG: GspH/FimT family pseudopilin [Gammaproteobacteria bacterium]|nr:GspH/FimT family pseudopilin [Gammaproteobacteria bacterium]
MKYTYTIQMATGRRQYAFTLTELLVTLSITSILLGSSAPLFTGIIMNNRVVTISNDLLTALQVARSEAVKRNQDVTLCKSADSLSCGGNWSDGWIIFSDKDHDRRLDPVDGDTLLYTKKFDSLEYFISWNAFRSDNYIQYNAQGFIHSNNGTFKLCPPDNDVHYARAIIINRVGRARVSADSNNDGVHEDSRGRALVC